VTGCTFSANSAADRGGGMYIFYGSSRPTLNRCTFTFNQAVMGGGIMSYGVPMLTRCTFIVNVAGLGGGMWSSGGELSRCVFGGNRSDYKGGGIFMSHDTSLTSCMLSGNSAVSGGAVFAEDCDITVTGCTITGNQAMYVGGVHNDEGSTFVSNCILWNNRDADGEDESAQIDTADPPSVDYCCIQGWTGALGGTGNIGANPAFIQPGHWDTTDVWVDGDYHLLSGSPCINTGDPSYIHVPGETDLDGNPRIIGGRIDIGAYEFKGPRIIYVDDDATGKTKSEWVGGSTNPENLY
ncbi:MAG: choice-of-anchor Q domain-containing protein, partial [Planctomycetota bacterium]